MQIKQLILSCFLLIDPLSTIVENEQDGNEKAEYGKATLENLFKN